MNRRHKVAVLLDGFLSKASRQNKPYQAVKRTDNYKQFHKDMREGIKSQADWVADNMPDLMQSIGKEDDLEPMTIDQVQKLRGQISRDMPGLSDFVTEHKVFTALKEFFEYTVRYVYKDWGYMVKAAQVEFKLTNTEYINAIKNRASYLLNQSSLDETTLDQLIRVITDSLGGGNTAAETSKIIQDEFEGISEARADMIARTEAANAAGEANHATMVENGVKTKRWVTAGNNPDEECQDNEADGEIPLDQDFSSGVAYEPAHPNCECYTEAGEIDLDTISIWDGN